jgi:hypothetical protein
VAILGAWMVAGSVLYRTPFAEASDWFPAVLGTRIDTAIVAARASRGGVLAEILARAGISVATTVGVYAALRSPLWAAGAAATCGFAMRLVLG